MIIKSSRNNSKFVYAKKEETAIVNEEVKPLDSDTIHKPKRKKSTPVVIEEPIVVEEKIEDEDLSKWLKEHTED